MFGYAFVPVRRPGGVHLEKATSGVPIPKRQVGDAVKFRVGKRVKHKILGNGKIQTIVIREDKVECFVKFDKSTVWVDQDSLKKG